MDVTVEVDESPQVDAQPEVIVVDTNDSPETEIVIDHAERLARIEMRLDALESATATAQITAEIAQSSADSAVAIADDTLSVADTALELANEVAEIAVSTAENTGVAEIVAEETSGDMLEDVTPHKTHWLFRSADEWRRGLAD